MSAAGPSPLNPSTCRLLTLMAALLILAGTASAHVASTGGQEKHAEVELIVPKQGVRPGETLPVGVKFTMEPGWHIYWTNPGDSGDPPVFSWNLPGGGASGIMRGGEWEATDPEFPTPIAWTDPGGLQGYGYAGEVIFPATLTVPASTTPGQEVEVTLAANYLICRDVCLPEQATASVKLSVSPDASETDSEAEKALEEARAAVPEESRSAEMTADGDRVELTVPMPADAKNVGFFPDPPRGLAVEDIEVTARENEATISLKLRTMAGAKVEEEVFPAVVGYDTADGRRGVEISVAVPDQPDE